MRAPLSWIRDFTPVDAPVDEIVTALNQLGLEVDAVEELGSDAYVYGTVPTEVGASREIHFSSGEAQMIARIDPRDVPKKGETVWVTIRKGEQHVFSSSTGARLDSK